MFTFRFHSTPRFTLQGLCLIRSKSSSASNNKWLKRQSNDVYTKTAKSQNLRSRAAFKLMEIDDHYHLFHKNKEQRILDLGFAPGAWSQVARRRTSDKSLIIGVDILPCEPPPGVTSIQANILSQKTLQLIRLYFSKHFELNKHYPHLTHENGYFNHTINELEQKKLENEQASYREVFSNINAKEIETLNKPNFDTNKNSNDENPINNNNNNIVDKFPIDLIISDMYEPWPQNFLSSSRFTNNVLRRLANTSGVAIRDHLQSVDLCDAALVTAIELLKPNGSFLCKMYTGKEDQLFQNRMKKVFNKVSRIKPLSSRSESKEIYFIGMKKRKLIDKLDVFNAN
ncbi:hypothetical protein TBLA_0A06070 [Henningerozyma blattae CBS 6284]|uniref:rRNA methyltransferase 2, mitochondrial n=1 Tax=Henningerozyma blattae (strain ATCC 34711 / CBS 6284 / DSM 70876 / NBRC 10599 / NRRL Y-10934 / UCD 77-7) TaxID=1071380 RepID=I2GW98_HENB6|nr:hypothetical protein TBLA_0A06070 [Tetrapisispora blattae CBS 6284]CCH58400.1 hypothetical protein TBLA_0A06070 [Tetrapisispora blattae CBS 6284]